MKPAEMVNALKKAGFEEVRQTGSHIIMWKAGLSRTIPVPLHNRVLKRTLQNKIIKEAGFSEEEFLKYL